MVEPPHLFFIFLLSHTLWPIGKLQIAPVRYTALWHNKLSALFLAVQFPQRNGCPGGSRVSSDQFFGLGPLHQ